MQDGMREMNESFTSGDFFIVTGSYNDMQQFRSATLLSGISTQIYGDKITATSVVPNSYLQFAGVASPTTTGSPILYGNTIYAGSNATNAGGSIWTAFAANYTAHPYVLLTGQRAGGPITVGSITIGSFWTSGTASVNFDWMAIGK
jgi:hypothetical protein